MKNYGSKYLGQWDKISRMAIIGDGYVRMANLAIVGSHSVNGVAKLHTEIIKKERNVKGFLLLMIHLNLIIKQMVLHIEDGLIRSNPRT